MRASAEEVFPGPFRKLEKLLWEWTWLNREMAKSWKWKDCPWWYNERASISILAGAIWNTRGIALEEYASRKRKGRANSHGRCDLYFKLGNTEYVTEAKHCWLNAGRQAKHMTGIIEAFILDACRDSERNRHTVKNDETLLGILFIVPRIPPLEGKDTSEIFERLIAVQKSLKEVAKKEKCALAWVFPRNSRKSKPDDDTYIYPGTAVLIKRVG
jgi:hypothetical protein